MGIDMLNELVSYLVSRQGYVDIDNFSTEHVSLVEFFDRVMISVDDAKLCLVKTIDNASEEELSDIARFGRELALRPHTGKNIRYQAVVFFVSEETLDPDTIRRIMSFSDFTRDSSYRAVVIDGRSRKVYFDIWKIPFSFLPVLYFLKKKLQVTPGMIPDRDALRDQERRNIQKVQKMRGVFSDFRPYMTWILIGVNLLIWLALDIHSQGFIDSYTLLRFGAKVNPLIWEGELWRLITPAFLHAGFMHLFLNSIILLLAGPLVEAFYGRWRFLLIYLVAVITGNLASVVFSPYFSVGASSAWYGILGALAAYSIMHRREIPLHFLRITTLFLIIFLMTLVLLGLQFPNTDNYAHLGGFVGGFCTASLVSAVYPSGFTRKVRKLPAAVFAGMILFLGIGSTYLYGEAYKYYYMVLGEKAAVEGDYPRAAGYLERSLDFDGEYFPVRNLLGKVYYNMAGNQIKESRPDGALHYLLKARKNLDITEENHEILSHLNTRIASQYSEKYLPFEAIRFYKYALVFDPGMQEVRERLAEEYMILARQMFLMNDLEKSEQYAELALKYSPLNKSAKIFVGKLLYIQGDFVRAASIWKETAESDGGDESACLVLNRYIFKNLWYPTKAEVNEHRWNPEAAALNREGESLLRSRGDYQKARDLFLKASDMDAGFPVPLLNLARIEIMLGNPSGGGEYLSRVLERDGSNREARVLRGAVLLQQSEVRKAQEALQESSSLGKGYGEYYAQLAEVLLAAGNKSGAEQNFRKALELEPFRVPWKMSLARIFDEANRNEEFLREVNSAMVFAASSDRRELETVLRNFLVQSARRREKSGGK